MNKKGRVLSILVVCTFTFLLSTMNVYSARNSSHSSNTGSSCHNKDNSWNTDCANKYGITINATDYERDSGYLGNGQYKNDVKNRTVTIKLPDKDGIYTVRVIEANSGTLAEVSDLEVTDLNNANEVDTDEDDNTDIRVKKKTLKDVDSYTINISPGRDAYIFVLLKSSKLGKTNKKVNLGSNCEVTLNNGNKKQYPVTCAPGKAALNNGVVQLTGVAAAMLVENPDNSNLIDNIRQAGRPLGNACTQAKQDLGSDYYSRFLGDYCEAPSVPFLLDEQKIKDVSKSLKDLSVSKTNLSQRINSGEIKSIGVIEQEIINIRNSGKIAKEFASSEQLNTGLSCSNSDKETKAVEYLYTTEESSQDVEIEGTKYNVCKVKCYEHLTVQYDPPVASIAGLCFTYKVTVKSVSKCGVEDNSDKVLNELPNYNKTMCSPVPICEENASSTQGGPSEEFDSCIKKCDGGKYSQKCIDSCYKKIYDNKSLDSKNLSVDSNQNLVKKLNDNQYDYKVVKVANALNTIEKAATNENKLQKYFDYKNLPECDTKHLKKYVENGKDNLLEACSKYFFNAKAIYPYGDYNNAGTNWRECGNNYNHDSTECYGETIDDWAGNTSSDNPTYIPMQIARSSPFYLRDVKTTKQLIIDLLGKNERGRKYVIDNHGYKRQKNSIYTCDATCHYTGCSDKNALNGGQYKLTRTKNIDKITAALNKCSASAACDTTEKTAEFKISIENPRRKEKNITTEASSTNESNPNYGTSNNSEIKIPSFGSTSIIYTPNENAEVCNPGSPKNFSMFVPREGDGSQNGILGLCYDDNNTTKNLGPHYQTTITFPGSWINYKSAKISYNNNCDSNWEDKEGYYCSAYDTENINDNWWKWRMETRDANGNLLYQTAPNPEKNNNIKASINNFGKYNWHIDYSCFYAIYDGANDIPDINRDGEPDCIKNPDDKRCPKTGLNDYKFKVVDTGDLFSSDSNQKQGYNWTSAARIEAGINHTNADAQTYAINPEKYLTYIRATEKDESIYDNPVSQDDYYIYIPSEGIDYIKSKYKNQSYTGYNGTFTKDTNINGLVRYTSDVLTTIKGQNGITVDKRIGDRVNNNYNNLNSLLGS